MRFGSLFAGIGGLDLGLERAGMQCAWQVEIDDYCRRVLTKHWPNVPKFRDVRECGAANLSAVDIVCGGFPCQPFSVAGKRRGTADDRHLWPEMLRIIDELRPAFVLGENVPGLIPMALDAVFDDLEACGYEARAITFPAASLGAWHRRDRLWILAYSNQGKLRNEPAGQPWRGGKAIAGNDGAARTVAHSKRLRRRESAGYFDSSSQSFHQTEREESASWTRSNGETVTNAHSQRLSVATRAKLGGFSQTNGHPPGSQSGRDSSETRNYWAVEPNVGRVAHGIPRRVDRLRGLGNAVVPQCAEFIGRLILQVIPK